MNRKLLFLSVTAIIIFLIYTISLDNPFYWDDEELVVNNYVLRTPLNFKNYFFSNPIPQRPVVTFSFALNYVIFGLKPFGYHLTQILLHICNTALVFYIANLTFRSERVSALSGAIFALHPIHTEAVNLFLGRSDLVCCFFFLTSFLLYIKSLDAEGDRKKLFYYFSLITYVLSMLSKEIGIVLPFLIIIYDRVIGRTDSRKSSARFASYIPYFVLSVFYFVFWYLILHGSNAEDKKYSVLNFWGGNIYSNFLMQLVVIKKYIKLLLIPAGMSGWYEIPAPGSILNADIFISTGILTLLVLACIFKLRKESLFSVLWLFVTFLPISNLIPIPGSMMAERWLYIPSVGFSFFLALIIKGLESIVRQNNNYRRFVSALLVIFFVLYSLLSYARNLDYDSEVTFFKNIYDKSPSSQLARSNLGLAYLRENHPDDSIKILEPLAKEGKSPFLYLILNNLGGAYEKKGNFKRAEKFYKAAAKLGNNYADANINLGSLYMNLGRTKEAKDKFNEVIKMNPINPHAHYNLGLLCFMEGRDDEAIKEYEESIKMRPDLADVHSNLGLVYYRKGFMDLARMECEKAIKLDPKYPQAYGNLGLIYMEQGDENMAVKNFKRVLEIDPKNSLAIKYMKEIEASRGKL